MSDRDELIIQHFDYLINEYGFHIERKDFDTQAMGNAVVVFKSLKFGIKIVIDRNQVLINIGEESDPTKKWFELSDVVKYYAPYIGGVYNFPEKTVSNTWDEVVEMQLNRLALMLRQYCEPLLRGESWMKEKIKEIQKKRTAEILKKLGQSSANLGEGE